MRFSAGLPPSLPARVLPLPSLRAATTPDIAHRPSPYEPVIAPTGRLAPFPPPPPDTDNRPACHWGSRPGVDLVPPDAHSARTDAVLREHADAMLLVVLPRHPERLLVLHDLGEDGAAEEHHVLPAGRVLDPNLELLRKRKRRPASRPNTAVCRRRQPHFVSTSEAFYATTRPDSVGQQKYPSRSIPLPDWVTYRRVNTLIRSQGHERVAKPIHITFDITK